MAGGKVLKAGGATATPVQVYNDAQTRNTLLHVPGGEIGPGGVVLPPEVVEGPLGNTVGGRQTDPTKPARLSVFLGPLRC